MTTERVQVSRVASERDGDQVAHMELTRTTKPKPEDLQAEVARLRARLERCECGA